MTDRDGAILELEVDHRRWLPFLRTLNANGLTGVRLVISDAHPGLVAVVQATFLGSAWESRPDTQSGHRNARQSAEGARLEPRMG